MPYDVHVEQVSPRVLAAVRADTTPRQLSTDIIRLLDQVWPLLREQGARTGHNVVIYHPGEGGEFPVEAGVEVFSDFEERGAVRRVTAPAGEAAVVAHYGDYSAMGGAYAALDQWCAASGRHLTGVNWEVYGDWYGDPAKLRTDVYKLLSPDREAPERPFCHEDAATCATIFRGIPEEGATGGGACGIHELRALRRRA